MVVAENLSAPLAHAARADVESRMAAIALGEEDRFLEDGHDENYRGPRCRLHGVVYTSSRFSYGTDSPCSMCRRRILRYRAQQWQEVR